MESRPVNTIRDVSNDYPYLYEYFKQGQEFPVKNKGFNMAFAPYKNKYIFVIRFVFKFKHLLNPLSSIPPGIDEKMVKEAVFTVGSSKITNDFIWDWKNYYVSNIFFVGNIKNLTITVDKTVKPFSYINPISYLPANKTVMYAVKQEDFRLHNFNGRIYCTDSMTNQIGQLFISDTIKYIPIYRNVCNLKYGDQLQIHESDKALLFHKLFEKNWSLYKVEDNVFHFFHDFTEQGIEGVQFNAKTGKCTKELLVPCSFKNSDVVRFSFGSSCCLTDKGYIGLGHLRIEANTRMDKSKFSEFDKRMYQEYLDMHNLMKMFKKRYKPHQTRQYYMFFFLYNKKFYISPAYMPMFPTEYMQTIVFPMAVIKQGENLLISMGYGDHINVLMKYPIKKIEFMDVQGLDLMKYPIKKMIFGGAKEQ